MKVFITGATGFLAQHIIETTKHTITGCDLHPKKNQPKYSQCNIVKEQPKIPAGAVVIHCAGLTPKANASKNDYMLVNYDGTKNVFLACKKKNIKRFIFISSNWAAIKDTVSAKKTYVSTAYGESKLAAEEYLRRECKKSNIPLTILRVSGIYGPGMPATSGYGKLFTQLRKSTQLITGNAKYQLTYVRNVAYVVNKSMRSKKQYELYSIADKPELTLKDIGKIINPKSRVVNIPWPIAFIAGCAGTILNMIIRRKKFPDMQTVTNLSKTECDDYKGIYRAYNIKQKYSQKQGIKETLKWIKK